MINHNYLLKSSQYLEKTFLIRFLKSKEKPHKPVSCGVSSFCFSAQNRNRFLLVINLLKTHPVKILAAFRKVLLIRSCSIPAKAKLRLFFLENINYKFGSPCWTIIEPNCERFIGFRGYPKLLIKQLYWP